jgi:hypothetical protein
VFLCGAGVSAPQVPMFGKLVDCVYKKIGIEPTAAEALAIKNWRYEEALGAVSRRLANPARIYSEVTSILTRDIADLSHHKTLLRLSRARDNRLLLVTTNFECLFERAVDENEVRGQGKALSLAGQALPPPWLRSVSWHHPPAWPDPRCSGRARCNAAGADKRRIW